MNKNIYWKFHLVLNDVNSESQVDKVDMVEFSYHGGWYTLLIIDIINWNDLEKFVNKNKKIFCAIDVAVIQSIGRTKYPI